MAFQVNAFQNNAFQIISRVKARVDYEEVFTVRDEERDRILRQKHKQRRLEILAQEAYSKKLEELKQAELEELEMLLVLLLIEESESE